MVHDHALDGQARPDLNTGDGPAAEEQHGDAARVVDERALERTRSRHRLDPKRADSARHAYALTPLHVGDDDARRPRPRGTRAPPAVPGAAWRGCLRLASLAVAASIRGVELVERRADSAFALSELERHRRHGHVLHPRDVPRQRLGGLVVEDAAPEAAVTAVLRHAAPICTVACERAG